MPLSGSEWHGGKDDPIEQECLNRFCDNDAVASLSDYEWERFLKAYKAEKKRIEPDDLPF